MVSMKRVAGILMVLVAACSGLQSAPLDRAAVRQSAVIDGTEYVVVGADLYEVRGEEMVHVFAVYDPDEMNSTYRAIGDTWEADTQLGWVEVIRTARHEFDDARALSDVVTESPTAPFHGVVIRDASGDRDLDYYAGSSCVVAGECRPDSSISVRDGVVTFEAAPESGIDVVKASAVNRLLYFVEGDDVWISGRFWFEEPLPYSVIDLESTWLHQHAGIRLVLSGDALAVELKWGEKPKWRQVDPAAVPLGRWVDIIWHLSLDSNGRGVIEVWQDGQLVLSDIGQTLPLSDTVYDSLEIGISAHDNSEVTRLELDSYSFGADPPDSVHTSS